jgi:hypothetical protein
MSLRSYTVSALDSQHKGTEWFIQREREKKNREGNETLEENGMRWAWIEHATFRSSVWRSPNWAIPATELQKYIYLYGEWAEAFRISQTVWWCMAMCLQAAEAHRILAACMRGNPCDHAADRRHAWWASPSPGRHSKGIAHACNRRNPNCFALCWACLHISFLVHHCAARKRLVNWTATKEDSRFRNVVGGVMKARCSSTVPRRTGYHFLSTQTARKILTVLDTLHSCH